MFIDAKKAHLNPECREEVYIELPEEAGAGVGRCGKLLHWLYGCRRAAQAWETFYSEKLQGAGFVRGRACGVLFYHPGRDISLSCHGDDFMAAGEGEDLRWLATEMSGWFEIKVRAVMGPEEKDDKEVVILGRCVRWKEWGIEFEADPKHRQIVMKHFGLGEGSAAGRVNGDRERREEEEDGEEMEKSEATEFRGLAARLNYLSQDAPDVQFAAKEVAREMARPARGGWRRMKKVARYLVSREAVVWGYRWQEGGEILKVKTDSDWGGSRWDRKSTSGGMLALGSHCLKTWSATQGAVALSSAEAEFYAMVDGVMRAKWAVTIARELGCEIHGGALVLGTDSAAAKSFVSRRGLGKMRHLEVRDLWLQEEVLKGNVRVEKIPGDRNPADLMTKFLGWREIEGRLEGLGRVDRREAESKGS